MHIPREKASLPVDGVVEPSYLPFFFFLEYCCTVVIYLCVFLLFYKVFV